MESLCPYYWVKPQKEAAHVAGKEKELTVLMKESTAKLHETSDNLINVKLLLALTDRSHFGQALGLFYCVFKSLDDAVKSQQELRRFYDGAKLQVLLSSRIPAFERDLQSYLGPDWVSIVEKECRSHAQPYCDALDQLRDREPMLLIPYVYHLSLALLAGGQTIKKLTQRAFPKSVASVELFDYSHNLKRFELKRMLKQATNGLALSDDMQGQFLHHSAQCFRLNNRMIVSYYASKSILRQICRSILALLSSLPFNFLLALICLFYLSQVIVQ